MFPDSFCYICVKVTFKSQKRGFTPLIKKCYKLYFGCKVVDEDKLWVPHFVCVTCVRLLAGWSKGSRHMNFAVPMIWQEPKVHSTDCYFCLTNIIITSKSKHTVIYPNLPSAMRPVPQSDELLVPQPPENLILSDDEQERDLVQPDYECVRLDQTFEASCSSSEPI